MTQKEGTSATCCQGVKFLLEIYATDDIIAEEEDSLTNYTQPENMLEIRCS